MIINKKKISKNDIKEIINKYELNSVNCFTYNEFMMDSLISRPYILKWGKSIYKELLLGIIVIYIKIDIDALYKVLNQKFKKLKIRKARSEDYKLRKYLIFDDRMIFFETKGEPFYIGRIIIYRICGYLYITKDLVNDYYNSCLEYYPEAFN